MQRQRYLIEKLIKLRDMLSLAEASGNKEEAESIRENLVNTDREFKDEAVRIK